MRLEAKPHVAVAPNGDVLPLCVVGVLLQGSCDRLQDLVMGIRPRSFRIQSHRHNIRLKVMQKPQHRQHIALLSRFGREDVGSVETQSQMGNVGQLPADVPPNAFCFKLATGPFQGLDVLLVLLSSILLCKIRSESLDSRKELGGITICRRISEDDAQVVDQPSRSTLVSQLVVRRSDAVQEFPDITAAKIDRCRAI
eukprot:Skav232124  [mRNA]  locus=scaffold2351:215176:225536:+ [translate_table: standard]